MGVDPKNVYQFYIDVITKGRTFLSMLNRRRNQKLKSGQKWNTLTDYFECSTREVEDHLEILTKEQVTTIIMKYGVDDKQLKKIWSK